MEQFLTLLPTLFSLVGPINHLIQTGVSVNSVATTIRDPAIVNAFQTLGTKLFPHAAPEMQVAAAIVTSYSPNYTMWVQNMLNAEGANPKLVVDGNYGPATQAAVKQAQSKFGLKVDGWAGDVTSAALQAVLAKAKQLHH